MTGHTSMPAKMPWWTRHRRENDACCIEEASVAKAIGANKKQAAEHAPSPGTIQWNDLSVEGLSGLVTAYAWLLFYTVAATTEEQINNLNRWVRPRMPKHFLSKMVLLSS